MRVCSPEGCSLSKMPFYAFQVPAPLNCLQCISPMKYEISFSMLSSICRHDTAKIIVFYSGCSPGVCASSQSVFEFTCKKTGRRIWSTLQFHSTSCFLILQVFFLNSHTFLKFWQILTFQTALTQPADSEPLFLICSGSQSLRTLSPRSCTRCFRQFRFHWRCICSYR